MTLKAQGDITTTVGEITSNEGLTMDAGGDIAVTGSDVSAVRDATLTAGGNVTITAQETRRKTVHSIGYTDEVKNIASTVAVGGNLTVNAGGDARIKSAQIAMTGGQAAKSVANALRLKTELSLKQANILTNEGKLTDAAIATADKIRLKGVEIKNPSIVHQLTKDGSKIADWEKYTTQSVPGPNGSSIQVHFYKNIKTRKVDYETPDFKVKGLPQPEANQLLN